MAARKRNFPSRKNIEEKKKREETGQMAGRLNESELSKLEIKLRKKITILTGDAKEEKRREKELRYLQKNINYIRKRKPKRSSTDDSRAPLSKKRSRGIRSKRTPETISAKPDNQQSKVQKEQSASDDDAPPQEVTIKKTETPLTSVAQDPDKK